MIISNREKDIIRILLEQNRGISIDYLSEKLNVSSRTIYRELPRLEATLEHFNMKLAHDLNGYRIESKGEELKKLKNEISKSPEELTIEQRQNLLMIKLLFEEQTVKMESLATDLNVSLSTIQSDLEMAADFFKMYQLEIIRKKAKGIKVVGPENSRRLIATGFITSEINEYVFFHLFTEKDSLKKKDFTESNNPFLKLLKPSALEAAYHAIKSFLEENPNHITDIQYQRLVIFLALTIMRIEEGKYLTTLPRQESLENEIQPQNLTYSENILFQLNEENIIKMFKKAEVVSLALQLQIFNARVVDEFSEEYDMTLDFQVRKLIRDVSKGMGWSFNQDEVLFKDLLNHIATALNRAKAPIPEGRDNLLEKIQEEYPKLSQIVKENLEAIFPEVIFLSNEIIYIVLHFASSYESTPSEPEISALVICSSGVGTAKILESRLRRNIPDITTIQVARVSELSEIDLEDYDLILSTIFLRGLGEEYKVVSPMLMDNEVKSVQNLVEELQAKQQKKFGPVKSAISQPFGNDFKSLYEKINEANTVFDYFDIINIENKENTSIAEILRQVCVHLEDIVLEHPEEVAQKLIKRMELAPIGLPDSNIGLFHTVAKSVTKPYFGIYQLTHPIEISGVDRKPLQLKRILLMLGPDPLAENAQEILGSISAAVVESTENTELFNQGSATEIRDFLSQLFLNELK